MAIFQIQGLDHVVLRVRDQTVMTEFYCEVLGCSIERCVDDAGLKQLRAGTSLIDLVDINVPTPRNDPKNSNFECHNMDHFCLRIEPFDAKMLVAHLQAHGINPGPVERRYGAEGFGPSIYFNDPEGNRIELKGSPSAG